jgi:hypothetical protein
LFDALEKAGTDIMGTASLVTQRIIAYRYITSYYELASQVLNREIVDIPSAEDMQLLNLQ